MPFFHYIFKTKLIIYLSCKICKNPELISGSYFTLEIEGRELYSISLFYVTEKRIREAYSSNKKMHFALKKWEDICLGLSVILHIKEGQRKKNTTLEHIKHSHTDSQLCDLETVLNQGEKAFLNVLA